MIYSKFNARHNIKMKKKYKSYLKFSKKIQDRNFTMPLSIGLAILEQIAFPGCLQMKYLKMMMLSSLLAHISCKSMV